MSDFYARIQQLSPSRLALLALELHEENERLKAAGREPLAIVGIGCRMPGGVEGTDAFWRLLREGRDATGEVPPDRWAIDDWFDADPDAAGTMASRRGGFLQDIDRFDAAFFGISPREALTMDPQQRLLLEVSWEALEDAAIAPSTLFGTSSGVFVGVCNADHFHRVLARGPSAIDAYVASGNADSVAAGRIAYALGLQGPALAVDTACSSSLVAIHLACRSLRAGESDLALAGGVNIMCTPETSVALSRGHMLAPDGRCKTFDARADGFARAEGCGIVVLKRLGDALRDRDRILALVRGTAVNQDGRSGGLTVPNGPAQEAVIRAALADADVRPDEIDYVEAHGTGTSLGDPIEVRALAGALGAGRPADRPLLIGSVKTNIGHLESAAGVAGLIKVALSLQAERLPAHLHFETPNPHITWDAYPVEVTAAGRPWPRGERRRLAGVSSFGFSGTNAHVVIEEAVAIDMAPDAPAHVEPHVVCVPLSARSTDALETLARRTTDSLRDRDVSLLDAAHTMAVGRSAWSERAAVIAGSTPEALGGLDAVARGERTDGVRRGTVADGVSPDVVFLYTGAGAQ
ncbi:MAG: beta-ketoacyl synthase N-terminal-like domain-containing protein [Vicinamibacterales bacterium]